jgi:hypothetical protein
MMTKNAITVIDQELIDWFDNEFVFDINNPAIVTAQVEELLEMAKDLIEINAELTKREQKVLSLINGNSWNGYNAVDVIDALYVILRGEW